MPTCSVCEANILPTTKVAKEADGTISACESCASDDYLSGPFEEPTEGKTHELMVRVRRQRFKASDSSYGAYSVCLEGKQDLSKLPEAACRDFIMSGPVGSLAQGDVVSVVGEFETHPKYGFQFSAKGPAVLAIRESQIALMSFLTRLPQIGVFRAGEVVRTFGGMSEVLDVLDHRHQELTKISGVTSERADEIKAKYDELVDARNFILWASSIGIPEPAQAILMESFSTATEAQEALLEDPYDVMADIAPDMPLKRIDEVAKAVGVDDRDPRRVLAFLRKALDEAEAQKGYTYALRKEVQALPQVKDLGLDVEALNAKLEQLTQPTPARGKRRARPPFLRLDGDRVYLHSTWLAERSVAASIRRLQSGAPVAVTYQPDAWKGLQPAPEQEAAVRLACEHPVTILTGGPGSGKTLTTRVILDTLEIGGGKSLLLAPTGKAAKRLSELAGRQAFTIHKALAPAGKSNDAFFFEERVVLIDEASMVDVHLCAEALASVRNGSRVIFVGDVDQLPSIGPGQILRDLIESNCVPTTRLTRVFRQVSDGAQKRIPDVAKAINQGAMPDLSLKGTDVNFLVCDNPEEVAKKVVWAATDAVPKKYGFSPNDVQVIAPQRGEQGKANWPIGTRALNLSLQDVLNPRLDGQEQVYAADGYVIRPGSRVVQRKNNYAQKIVNGDIGTVIEVRASSFIPADDIVTSARTAAAEMSRRVAPKEDTVQAVVQFDHAKVGYTRAELRNLHLAYAITVHVSQGSGYPAVIVPVHRVNSFMLTRQLVYTALTRAEKYVLFVGEREAIEAALKNIRGAFRRTALQEFLASDDEAPDPSSGTDGASERMKAE